ncbi:Benzoylformate decarboxylase [Granulicella mallensis MP5ACTX8]|uniref:Benzoylformate decarboxylase n=1 Tax=Granulicella mallensis (strain ATCC BAA-1857 / DSM 23137 / MP5ACTX8) TaxID=682795 RepID=G8P0E9_GRAMM|nr:Benzoylformate decarboxylase [Granulicella mallensis MP5ACTX8]
MNIAYETRENKVASGRECLLEILRDEGVTHVFGNPGTTELALIDALAGDDDFHFILGLQEAAVVGMADGYAQATGRPSFVNLHTTAGLGNGMGNLTNAFATNVPMVVTAGQQDIRHLAYDPLLSGDLVGLARATVKWAHEVRSLQELPIILRRAFRDANTEPRGPVFVSLPMNIIDEIGTVSIPPRSTIVQAESGDISQLVRLLVESAGNLCLVVGDEVGRYGATEAAVRVAELLGAPVYGSPFHSNVPFPTDHPLWRFTLPPNTGEMRKVLGGYDRILLIGDRAFMSYTYSDELPLSPKTQLLQIAVDRHSLGRCHAVELGLYGDPLSLLAAVGDALSQERALAPSRDSRLAIARDWRASWEQDLKDECERLAPSRPLYPLVAADAVLRGVPPGTVIVDECLATNKYVRQLYPVRKPGEYYYFRGAGLGWGMPAAVGVSLGLERQQRVVCLLGDGAAMYSPQALWSAAHESLPITFVVFNNSEYNILKNFMRSRPGYNAQSGRFVGMEINQPSIDFCALARSMGVDAVRLTEPDDITAYMIAAGDREGPSLLEIPIAATAS